MANNKKTYGVVRLDNVNSIYTGHLFSVIGEEEEIIENGMIGTLGDLRETDGEIEREVRSLEKGATANEEPIVLVAHPEVNYDESRTTNNSLEYFHVPVGRPARAYALEQHDVFSVSTKMVDTLAEDAVVGNFVAPKDGARILEEVADKPTGAFIGKIVRKDKLGTATVVGSAGVIERPIDLIVIEVQKNSL